jgi:2-succinyl-6-hydroxy-2,4-cyclohexadiene-1-carboxylate synthase
LSAVRIALAHGFTQTARSWRHVETLLHDHIPDVQTVAVDLPGHGSASHVETDLWGAAEHLVAAGGTGTYIGYSMGGRVALHAALAHPGSVRRLVLIGATAGIVDDTERAERRRADEQLAAQIESEPLERFVDAWLRNPLFAGLTPESALRDDRLRNTRAGLAGSLRGCGTGTQTPLWNRLAEITAPTLILAGADDPKFCALGEELTGGIPTSSLRIIEHSGHSVHLEQPESTVAAIASFLDET